MNKLITAFIPILLMLSIGFSGWSFGPNLIQNGDFADARLDNASLPADWYQQYYENCSLVGDSIVWDDTNAQYFPTEQFINISYDLGSGTADLFSHSFQLDINSIYFLSFDFYPYDLESQTMQLTWTENDNSCSDPTSPSDYVLWNSTDAIEQDSNGIFNNLNISPLGGGWYRLTGIISTSGLISDSVGAVFQFTGLNPIAYSLDNVVLEKATYTASPQCIGWECPSIGKTMIQTILALIPLFVVVGIILITRPESVLTLAMELMIAGIMSVVMMSLI